MPFSKVERRVWNDETFRQWNRDTRDMWLYLLTCPHQNRLGCFVLDPHYAAADLQISVQEAKEALREIEEDDRILYDPDTRLLLIKRHLKYNRFENPNVAKGAVHDLEELPYHEGIYRALLEAIERFGEAETKRGKPFYSVLSDALREALPDGGSNPSERVTETLTEGSTEGSGQPFANPEPEPEQEPEPEEETTDATVEVETTSPSASEAADPPDNRSELRELADLGRERPPEDEVGAVTQALTAAWVESQPERPPQKQIAKQGAVAKRLAQDTAPRKLAIALYGMDQLYPHCEGEPWDLFDFERKLSKALAQGRKAMEAGGGGRADQRLQRKRAETLEAISGMGAG